MIKLYHSWTHTQRTHYYLTTGTLEPPYALFLYSQKLGNGIKTDRVGDILNKITQTSKDKCHVLSVLASNILFCMFNMEYMQKQGN